MKFVTVDRIPDKEVHHRHGQDLRAFLDRFHQSDSRYVRVEYSEDEYNSIIGIKGSLTCAIRRYHLPMTVHVINNVVYLEKIL